MEILLFIIGMIISLVLGYKIGVSVTTIWQATVAESVLRVLIKEFSLETDEVLNCINRNQNSITLLAEELLKQRVK